MDLVFNRTRKIPHKSWGQECSLCSSRHGVPIECSARGCKRAYHTTCAIRGKLKMQAIFGKNFKGGIKLRSYCKEHSPNVNSIEGQADKIDDNGVKEIDMTNLADDRLQEGQDELDYFWKYVDINEVHRNISEAYARAKSLKFTSLDDSSSGESPSPKKASKKPNGKLENTIRKAKNIDSEFKSLNTLSNLARDSYEVDPLMIDLIYRYWVLLRTANNGQSLIKFSPSALKEREFEQRKSILKLRIELERVRNLSYMIGKREKLKSSWLKTHQNIIKRTFSLINDLDPAEDDQTSDKSLDDANCSNHTSSLSANHHSTANTTNQITNIKKSLQPSQHLQPANNMFDESDQLINDLIYCDQIYEPPNITCTNSNYNNLSHQERSTLERRRTLSLVRRINRQLRKVGRDTSPLNPYAKNYIASKRNGSPIGPIPQTNPNPSTKVLRSK